jgi:hypothetical protein
VLRRTNTTVTIGEANMGNMRLLGRFFGSIVAEFAPEPPAHEKGPMQVSLDIVEMRNKYRLNINIIASKEDRAILKKTKMEMFMLCDIPNLVWDLDEFPKDSLTYLFCHSYSYPKFVDFAYLQQAEKAKEQIIANLYAMRSQLDNYKEYRDHPLTGKDKLEI